MNQTLPISVPTETNALLKAFQKSVKEILRENLIGIYIAGSLAEGTFNEATSDIDLFVVIKNPINDGTRKSLSIFHDRLRQEFPKWGHQLECSYLPCSMLKNISPYPPSEARLYVNGGHFYKQDVPYGFEWIINLYGWQRYGLALEGPLPQELLPIPIDIQLVQQASLLNFEKEWLPLLKNPEYLKDSYHQAYAIATACRTLYLAYAGKVGSKQEASLWVKNTHPQWKSLIEVAEKGRLDQLPGVVSKIQNFIKFTSEKLALKKSLSPDQ